MSWKTDSLEHLFNPKSIAVVGASDKSKSLGALTLMSLAHYQGKVYPINPRLSEINGLKCYAKVADVEGRVDLALIALRAPRVLSAITDCADAGVKGAIIFTAGFKELGAIGEKEQERIKKVANSARIAIIGPNCLGAGNYNISLNATFFPHPVPLVGGDISIASQSGGVTGLLLYSAFDAGVGVSKFASLGNRVNIDFHDIIAYYRQDCQTRTICLFVEGTEYGREMYKEMAKTTSVKPILVFKVGKTPASRAAALSHTGSLAGREELYSAAIQQAGGLETHSVDEMIDTAKILSHCKNYPRGKRVAIVTHTLGIALITAQTLEQNGAVLSPPNPDIIETIQKSLNMPVKVPISNPIDLLAQGWANPQIFADAFDLIINEDQYDAVVIVFSPNFQEGIGGGLPAESVIDSVNNAGKLVVAVLSSPVSRKPPGYDKLEKGGIPSFTSPQRAGKALANVIAIGERMRELE